MEKVAIGADVDGSASKPGHVRVYEIVDTQISLNLLHTMQLMAHLRLQALILSTRKDLQMILMYRSCRSQEGGSSYSLTSSDVEVNSRTEFSVSLNEADNCDCLSS